MSPSLLNPPDGSAVTVYGVPFHVFVPVPVPEILPHDPCIHADHPCAETQTLPELAPTGTPLEAKRSRVDWPRLRTWKLYERE